MKIKNEKQILFIIKYALPSFILIVSLIITIFLYYKSKSDFEKLKAETQENFISEKKFIIKEQVESVYNYIMSEQLDTENALRKSLILRVNEAHKIIQNIYNTYDDTLSKEELTKLIKTSIKDIRFNNNRGYFFVYDKKAVNIIHPLLPMVEGKSLINHQDTKGTYVLRESLALLENADQSYQEWYWRKVKGDSREYKKIGFVKNIYELDWFIGTGEYVEDFSKDIQQKVLSQIKKFKFGKNDYFVVISDDDKYLSHIKPELIGTNVIKKLNSWNSTNILKKTKSLVSKGGGFITLEFSKPHNTQSSKKINYVKSIPHWNWIISTGFYLDEIQIEIDKQKELLSQNYVENIKSLFLIAFLSIVFLLILSFYISSLIEKKFNKYKEDLKSYINENQKQFELLSQKSKLASMGEMMENIAHQWRQPLSLITTASTGIKFQKEMDMLTDKFLLESVESIGNSANHLSETIEDFRDFFRSDKQKEFFKLEDSIDKTFKLLSSQMQKQEIEVIRNIKDVSIESYERELLQVLLNILNNAKDALEDCHGDKYIFIDIYEEENIAYIKIYDNAGGVKKDALSRIFEPHFTTKNHKKGTGLGLYMSKVIVEKHMSGELLVSNINFEYESKKYTGAMFTIKIPK